jgi:hypothetical protein
MCLEIYPRWMVVLRTGGTARLSCLLLTRGLRDVSLTLFSELVDGDGAAGHSHLFSLDGGHMCSR